MTQGPPGPLRTRQRTPLALQRPCKVDPRGAWEVITGGGARCQQVRQDGTPCRATARPSGFCFAHDPALAAKRTDARRKGGRERSRRAAVLPADTPDLPLSTVGDVVALLGQTLNQVRRGD